MPYALCIYAWVCVCVCIGKYYTLSHETKSPLQLSNNNKKHQIKFYYICHTHIHTYTHIYILYIPSHIIENPAIEFKKSSFAIYYKLYVHILYVNWLAWEEWRGGEGDWDCGSEHFKRHIFCPNKFHVRSNDNTELILTSQSMSLKLQHFLFL